MSARHLQRGLRQRAASTLAQIESGRPHVAPIPDRSVLEISGKDAQKFLKGLTSRDVDKSPGWGYSGFLTPTGRVLYDAFIYPTSAPADVKQTYLIDYPNISASDSAESDVPPLTNHLKRYVLRSKLKIRDVTEEYDTWSVLDSPPNPGWAPEKSWKFGSGGAAEITWKMGPEEGLARLGGSDNRSDIGSWDLRGGWGEGSMGRRFLVRKGDKPSAASDHDIADSDAYLLRRMLNGVPEGHQEMIPGTSLPLESCMDVMGGVDFRKGCYVGQELTVRTYHTGNTRKRIMPLKFDPPSGSTSGSIRRWSDIPTDTPRPRAGDVITFVPPESAASKKPKAGVKVLSVHPDYAVGLGLVRMEMVERVHGLPAFGEAGAAGSAEEVGSLVVGSVKLGDDIADNWRVFAGRGRGWYSPEEELAHQ